jgi:hypothetical protein
MSMSVAGFRITGRAEPRFSSYGVAVAALIALFGSASAAAEQSSRRDGGICTSTAELAGKSCIAEAQSDHWLALGVCRNLPNAANREACIDRAGEERVDAVELCGDQFDAREDVCDAIGEAAYAPAIRPADFANPRTNKYMPLVPGTTLVYQGDTEDGVERISVTVTDETETILGVKCKVVRDIARLDGEVIEDTIDWFAEDRFGNVWYFGEISKEFEDGRLVSLDGSWRAGVDGAKPGIVMKADPQVAQTYRQEFALGEAEDMGRVITRTGNAGVPATSCIDSCLVTRDFTPLEPDANERKYYKPNVGLILEIDAVTGDRIELVEIRRP